MSASVLQPLDGVRVLDLTRLIPGALTTRKLADLGAEVVKVEEPLLGDYLRLIPPLVDGEGVMHRLLNRGKKSIALDLKDEGQREIFFRLAAVADVIVEVSRPGRFKELGVDFAELRQRRPELVVCSVTGFGQDGPLAALPSHGLNMDTLAACVPVVWRDGRPRLAPALSTSLASELGAANAALAIAAALVNVRVGGEGSWIDASCWDAAAEMHRTALAQVAMMGHAPQLDETTHPLYDVYATKDGRVLLFCAIEQKFWSNFCRGVGRLDLLERWRGEGGAVDFGIDETLGEALAAIFARDTADRWFARFLEWDIPGSLVLDVHALAHHPHLEARGLVGPADELGVPEVRDAICWVDPPGRAGSGAPASPRLGADTDDVLDRWLGR